MCIRDRARSAAARLDALGASHGGEARLPLLTWTFAEASRLEADFWAMGLRAAPATGGIAAEGALSEIG